MPTSHTGQINTIIELITTINPKSILDIGIGNGKYGFLSREYLEIASGKNDSAIHKIRMDGIEAFPSYITDLQRLIYDNIYIGDASDLITKTETKYDLILLMDVFEHFTKEDGEKLLSNCLARATYVLISCPKNVLEQGAEYGNIYETHRFEWKKKHFNLIKDKVFVPNYYSLIVLFGKDAKNVKVKWSKKNLKIKLASRFPWLVDIYQLIK